MDSFHQVGIAFATAAAGWTNAFLLGGILWYKKHISFDHHLKKFISRMVLTCGGTVVLLKVLQFVLQPLLLKGELVRSLSVTGLVSFGLFGFLLLAHLMGAMKFKELKHMFARG
jgi:peptidoglycan biosynthesis protein MviN/MurJ (putative lipid II flippase)